MKIVYIVPGSGGTFYCQNCLRDNMLIKAMRDAGHDVVMVPMYLPMFSDNPEQADDAPIFYGAIEMYLKYKVPFLKPVIRLFGRLLNAKFLLRWAAKKSDSVKASGLENMTIAMLRGETGPMADDLEQLTAWLNTTKPDIIHISNSLLLGMAKKLKENLDAKIICSLQDEKHWLDDMVEPLRERVWELMSEKGNEVDLFISVSRHYADIMQERMQIPPESITVIPVGIDLTGYEQAEPESHPPVIGYLSKISETLGFGTLAEAFILLKNDEQLKNLQLHATGGLIGDDIGYVKKLQTRFAQLGIADDFKLQTDFERESRIAFLKSLTVLSVPIPEGEASGTYMLEAMASGVPVVQPDAGFAPELIEHTGGGVIYNENTAAALADALKPFLLNPQEAAEVGRRGREVVQQDYSISTMMEKTVVAYKELLI